MYIHSRVGEEFPSQSVVGTYLGLGTHALAPSLSHSRSLVWRGALERDATIRRVGLPLAVSRQPARRELSFTLLHFTSLHFVTVLPSEEPRGEARKEGGKRGRRPGRKVAPERVDMKAKLERSRQSARECRARKKLRYQYLEELVTDREKAVFALRKEFEKYQLWAKELDEGRVPDDIQILLEEMGVLKKE
ncbi:REPTOR-binding partner isoform X1 [Arctopsyche grandis]|uniref:REPTOR-binding partner isoform X1 n=1 Tax=Arctopsyche grandis TaxID=121162 RepID=UPI00406D836B